MELITGNTYDVSFLRLVGWTGQEHEGYNIADYFDAQGRYLGADEAGIEPIVEGARVEAGAGDDRDTGRIERIDGSMAFVSWDSGVKTPAPLADLAVI